jgi:hypothetical protein
MQYEIIKEENSPREKALHREKYFKMMNDAETEVLITTTVHRVSKKYASKT